MHTRFGITRVLFMVVCVAHSYKKSVATCAGRLEDLTAAQREKALEYLLSRMHLLATPAGGILGAACPTTPTQSSLQLPPITPTRGAVRATIPAAGHDAAAPAPMAGAGGGATARAVGALRGDRCALEAEPLDAAAAGMGIQRSDADCARDAVTGVLVCAATQTCDPDLHGADELLAQVLPTLCRS